MDRSEADGDLVLVQTVLLYYVNQVILMFTSIFQGQFPQQSKGGLYQNKVSAVSLTFTQGLGYSVHKFRMVYCHVHMLWFSFILALRQNPPGN